MAVTCLVLLSKLKPNIIKQRNYKFGINILGALVKFSNPFVHVALLEPSLTLPSLTRYIFERHLRMSLLSLYPQDLVRNSGCLLSNGIRVSRSAINFHLFMWWLEWFPAGSSLGWNYDLFSCDCEPNQTSRFNSPGLFLSNPGKLNLWVRGDSLPVWRRNQLDESKRKNYKARCCGTAKAGIRDVQVDRDWIPKLVKILRFVEGRAVVSLVWRVKQVPVRGNMIKGQWQSSVVFVRFEYCFSFPQLQLQLEWKSGVWPKKTWNCESSPVVYWTSRCPTPTVLEWNWMYFSDFDKNEV